MRSTFGSPQKCMKTANPYVSPTDSDTAVARAKSALFVPAICLLILTVCSLPLAAIAGFVIVLDLMRFGISGQPFLFPVSIGFAFVVISYILIVYGAIQMFACRRFGMARTAAIFAVIPVCSPLLVLGIPLGVWALIVLARPEVRDAFRGNAAQHSLVA